VNQSSSPNHNYFPLSKALLVIFLSTLMVSGSATVGWLYYLHFIGSRSEVEDYNIQAIIQTGPERESLKSVYLAELLGLSVDRPVNLYRFDTNSAEESLVRSPVIKTAKVSVQLPGTVYVDYTVRTPIAYVYDYENAAIDSEGVVFPLSPFFTPKKLTNIYLGTQEEISWGAELKNEGVVLSLSLLKIFSQDRYKEAFDVKRIDVSNAFSESYGQRQIVLILEDRLSESQNGNSRILRMSTRSYERELDNYLVLQDYLLEKEEADKGEEELGQSPPMIVDLRIPRLAFLKK
jgi:hypothetical protein